MKNFLLLIVALFCTIFSVFAQTETENLAKYQFYRQRFNQYFIIVGEHEGENMVIGNRNRYMGKGICFGQHSIHFGYYLGMVATEYALLVRNGDLVQAQADLQELSSALNAYCEQMDKCEHRYNQEDRLDGFFVRENVPTDFLDTTTVLGLAHRQALNQNLNSSHVYDTSTGCFTGLEKGMPAYVNTLFQVYKNKELMSQDEAYGIMMGLALIIKCVPDLAERAKEIFTLIALQLVGKNPYRSCPNDGYIIKKPDCQPISESSGGNTALFGYGIAAAAAKATGLPIDTFINSLSIKDYMYCLRKYNLTGKSAAIIGFNNMYYIWKICGNGVPGNQEWNRSMAATLGAIGDSWGKHTDKSISKNVYWKKGEKQHDWRTFYLSLWRFLHDKTPNDTEKLMIQTELNAAPPFGPYNYKSQQFPDNFAKGGWAYTYRYRATFEEQFSGSKLTGNFSGLDYMLMYNLYQLLYAPADGNIPPFRK